MATAIPLDFTPAEPAADRVLFAGTAEAVAAYVAEHFGADDGQAVALRTPEELDAFLGLDPACAPSS